MSSPKPLRLTQIKKAWRQRLNLPKASTFETKAKASWRRKLEGKNDTALVKALESANRIFVGDHRIQTEQTKQWLKLLENAVDQTWTLVTDRFDPKHHDIIENYMKHQSTFEDVCTQLGVVYPRSAPEGSLALVLEFARHKKLSLHLVKAPSSFAKQVSKMYANAKAPKTLVWTGSFKVAPYLYDKHANKHAQDVVMCLDGLHAYDKSKHPWMQQGVFWTVNRDDTLLNYEMTRIWMDEVTSYVSLDQLDETLHENMHALSTLMGAKEPKKMPRIVHPFDLSTIHKSKLDQETTTFINQRILRGESAVIPKADLILICQLDPASIAEEAMHYIRTHAFKEKAFGPWVTMWEEAWGMFGSLLADPHREIFDKESRDVWEDVHLMGYALGKSMFDAWVNGHATEDLKKAFAWQSPLEEQAKGYIEKMQQVLWSHA